MIPDYYFVLYMHIFGEVHFKKQVSSHFRVLFAFTAIYIFSCKKNENEKTPCNCKKEMKTTSKYSFPKYTQECEIK